MNTGQTVYEQLQEILNKCIELGWKLSKYTNKVKCIDGGISYNEHQKYDCYMSYHELFSKDSGLMEFVDWKKEEDAFLIISGKGTDSDVWYHNPKYHYMIMGPMTAEEKCNFFVKNAIIPTK